MPVIISVIVVSFLILIGWTWNNLGNIETKTKIIAMVIGLGLVYILTFIIFNISKMGIEYESENIMKTVRRVFVILFTIVNGFFILPFSFKRLNQINNEEITKEKMRRSIIILLIIIVVLFIFEGVYLGNMQQSLLDIMNR